jgi:hypothetical protein
MLAKVIRGRKGDPICEIDGILCLFDRRAPQPTIGETVEVMITHHPVRRFHPEYFDRDEAFRQANPPTVPFLFVRPVTADDVLLSHKGFECSGSMCSTTASVIEADWRAMERLYGRAVTWLTPGRSPVIETDNVNARIGQSRPLVPGRAFVSLADVRAGRQRICGLPDLDQVDPVILAMLVRRKSAQAVAA